ncbi:glycoside hydrolase family 76 protein [Actinomadura barringtoniae]|uniref:Glycoside hydrolase family 76 protein n=1 Tax=Actinomadura barringtoniae TaxID=1427535 RepID=A0A939T8Q2_9ACTN|nr:glycoside hydrolase family 76 protein [Actinomadura barringtoniae]MBO2453399.1 glycoside hydrolase family 76 protein [Actinomadura barringtoniae]
MTRRSRFRMLGVLAAGLVMTLLAGVVPAQAATRHDSGRQDRARASAAVEAMMGFYDRESGRFDPEAPWWQSGNALQALLDYMGKTRDRRLMGAVKNTITQQRKPLPWWPEGEGEFRADSTDDTGWWALAMVRMYDLTRDRQYLNIAKLDEAYIRKYWDSTCGGGVWWDIPGKSYKNAISLELYFSVLASLHNRIPGDRVYLAKAREAWTWFQRSGMINGQNLVNDGLTTQSGGCANNGGTTWTYNQGVVLGGLSELYKATHDRSLLVSARRIADAVVNSPQLSPNGILTEPCEAAGTCNADQASFKGIFARNLAELDKVVPGHPYRGYLRKQATSLYAHDRNAQDQYGLNWSGPFDRADISRQTSAVSLLVSVL